MKQKSKPIKIKTRTILWAFVKRFVYDNHYAMLSVCFMAFGIFMLRTGNEAITIAFVLMSGIHWATHAIIHEIREHRTIKIEKIVTELDGAALLEAFSKALDKK